MEWMVWGALTCNSIVQLLAYILLLVRRKRNGECEGCKARECQKCKYCLDMKKYGGQGRLRRPCIETACTNKVWIIEMHFFIHCGCCIEFVPQTSIKHVRTKHLSTLQCLKWVYACILVIKIYLVGIALKTLIFIVKYGTNMEVLNFLFSICKGGLQLQCVASRACVQLQQKTLFNADHQNILFLALSTCRFQAQSWRQHCQLLTLNSPEMPVLQYLFHLLFCLALSKVCPSNSFMVCSRIA